MISSEIESTRKGESSVVASMTVPWQCSSPTSQEEQERVLGDIEEIPQPRDRTLRSLLSAAEELGSGHMAKDG